MATAPTILPPLAPQMQTRTLQGSSQALAKASEAKRVLIANLDPLEGVSPTVRKIVAYYVKEAEKAQKEALECQRELSQALMREAKLHAEIMRLQARLDVIENIADIALDKKKEAKS